MSVVIVTGASGSMGRVATRKLAQDGFDVIMACRNLEKGEAVRREILQELSGKGRSLGERIRNKAGAGTITLLPLDLKSRRSVCDFVSEVGKFLDGEKLAGLFNNAGVLSRDYVVADDGLERTMSVNYLNTALLTRLLLPFMEKGANVVCMVSVTTKFAHIDLGWPSYPQSRYSQLGTYAMSKLALLYFAIGLSRRNPDLHVNVADPGVVDSNMITMGRWFDPLADRLFRPFISSPEKGVKPALAAMHSKDSLHYFVGRKSPLIPAKHLSSPLVDALWAQATELLGL